MCGRQLYFSLDAESPSNAHRNHVHEDLQDLPDARAHSGFRSSGSVTSLTLSLMKESLYENPNLQSAYGIW